MPGAGVARRFLKQAWLLAVGAVVLGVAGSGCGGGSSKAATPAPRPSSLGWREHVDAQAGFVIDYPENWSIYQPIDPGVQFLAGPNDHDFVEVRVISNLPVNFAPGDTQVMKQVVDRLLATQAIAIVSTTQVNIAGLTGWEYVYSFRDPRAGVGVHVHVFLFQGNRLHTIVLQALPASQLKLLAPTFDRILNHYRALPLAPTPRSTGASGLPAPSATSSPGPATPSP